MPDYHRIGTLRLSGLDDIAARAAKRIIAAKFPARYALTCDPDGIVQVEPIGHAVPDDIVGVYEPAKLEGRGQLLWTKLSRRIAEDLSHHRQVAHA